MFICQPSAPDSLEAHNYMYKKKKFVPVPPLPNSRSAPYNSFGRSVGLWKTLMGNQGCKTSYSCTFHGSIVQISFH